jgi:hypothetical protein
MGRFKADQEKECTMRIRNITRETVAIDRVAPSCVCCSPARQNDGRACIGKRRGFSVRH